MITMIRLCCDDEDGQPLKEKYANYELNPVELALAETPSEMVERIIEKGVDAVIIDYKLSSQKAISYSGVSLAKELHLRLYGFPIFVLTTYQDDLFDHELFGKILAAFQPGAGPGRTEHRNAPGPHCIRNALAQREFRSDNQQIDTVFFGKIGCRGIVTGRQTHTFGDLRNARIAGGTVKMRDFRTQTQSAADRMFSAAAS